MFDIPRTRFAPSPTGYLHVGGARTALFNYLLARRLGGKFILRIEDTDQARNIAGAERKLLDDLRWLGLQWDEGPEVGGPAGEYFQSRRLARYSAVADELLASGCAYYAFDTREELDALRAEALARKQDFRYPRPERFPTAAEADSARAAGRPVVVRFRMPDEELRVRDEILGEVTFPPGKLDDFVIVKADGWPTYHFAVVVDDQDMQITHVLRGQEHLNNTPRHVALQHALEYRTPLYAHLPIIMTMDGAKMSKREKDRVVRAATEEALQAGRLDASRATSLSGCADAAQFAAWRAKDVQLDSEGLEALARELLIDLPEIDVHDFRRSGYLPEVLLNFIALLGWSPGDGREKLTLDELCAVFSIDRVGKTNARFDRAKLLSFNTDGVAVSTPERLLAGFQDYLAQNPDSPLAGLDHATLARLLRISPGFRTYRELEHKCAAMFRSAEAIVYDGKAVAKVLRKNDDEGVRVLRELRGILAAVAPWEALALEAAIQAYAEPRGLGLGKVAQPLRVALTGGTVSPPIYDTLDIVGRDQTLMRIDRAIDFVSGEAS